MAATLFYLDPLPDVGAVAVLDGKEGRHAATVRRIRVGEHLVLADGRGGIARAEVVEVGKDRLDLTVTARDELPAASPTVTVVQALPKAERSELAVELATEAGIDEIVPWQSSRCVAKWEGPKAVKGVARWQAVAVAAAKQSRRPYIPQVADLHRTGQVLARVREVVAAGGVVLVLHEAATAELAALELRTVPEIVLVVGPEGGLADDEVAALTEAGAHAVRLGPTVLRTSTAAAVALGALGVLTDRWSAAPLA
ncbi:Ribosomal RNA small subunit methyltransferase E [Rhodococcus sp. RD6.2]|uniref:16S rRNA (uracil(1498)-N(3))-methyltransferase n=1 Tax=unclassified Rhodococcus (in: high G+C Gram-positive bacteria) TaxID=192944 RepID=UPI00063B2420|nr:MULTISPECIES: 16S rRNA (uracil(1498)-N(3))-methyltransferase [unclassified Rhodococcus (in: high G+C Gram-positive bacteria)]CRK51669.1 Ribosomal RNA small subunit methyltransferase E [Rhodococcus sp. RD6.2]